MVLKIRGRNAVEIGGGCEIELYCGKAYIAGEAVDRLAAYEDTSLEPEEVSEYKKFEDEAVRRGISFDRIVELMKAGEEGRLVVLPCREGETAADRRKTWDF